MFDTAGKLHGIAGLGLALIVAFALSACLQATPALANGEEGLVVATLDDEGDQTTTSGSETANEADSAEPKVTTENYIMRVYQELTISFEGATFTSSNKNVVSVSKSGLAKAKKRGKATITATNGSETYILNLTVKKSNFKPVPLKKLKRYSYFRKFMSEAQLKQAYKKALKLVRPLGDLKKKDQLMGVAARLRNLFDNGMTYTMSAKHYNDPYGYLVLKKASCAGCARATSLCLNILGINYEHVNENQYSHQWARVKVGKKFWICDAYGLYCGPEPAKRKHPYMQ